MERVLLVGFVVASLGCAGGFWLMFGCLAFGSAWSRRTGILWLLSVASGLVVCGILYLRGDPLPPGFAFVGLSPWGPLLIVAGFVAMVLLLVLPPLATFLLVAPSLRRQRRLARGFWLWLVSLALGVVAFGFVAVAFETAPEALMWQIVRLVYPSQ